MRYADLDLRSTAGKEYAATKAVLTAHLGGEENVTAPQRTLIDHAARLQVLTRLAWDELTRSGPFKHGETRPALDAFRRIAADLREVLRTLGLERRAREIIPDLATYIEAKRQPLRLKAPVEDAEDIP